MDLDFKAIAGFHLKSALLQLYGKLRPWIDEIALLNSSDCTVAFKQTRGFRCNLPALKAMNVDLEGRGALIESESQLTMGSF